MTESIIFYILLGLVSFDFFLERILSYLNSKSAKKPLPNELAGIYDEEKYAKSQAYNAESDQFGAFSATLSYVLTFSAIAFGWFGLLDKWLRGFSPFEPITTLLFFGVLFIMSDFISTPFSYYKTFVIEEKYGFNKMSRKLFWMDKLKGYLLTILIGGILLALLIYLVMAMGSGFWIYFWVIISVVILFLNMFYTSLLLPLFNKLTPLEDGELKSSITTYAQKVTFPLTNIFVMDGSKRSSKGNAFFSGLGKKKKVVLFDTLIENHTVEELTAVFAHEVGHFKKKHIILGTVISILSIGLTLYVLSLMVFNTEVSWAMGGDMTALHLNILAFGILYSPISMIIGLFSNALSRKNEFEADQYARDTYAGQPLIDGLKKLSSDQLSNMTPHPAYVFVHYSHPPLLQRIRSIAGK